MKLFLDTNVLIDFIMERPLFYDAAAMIVSYAFSKDFEESAIKVVSTEEACSLLQLKDENFENTEDFSSRPATASRWMFCQQVCAGGGVYIK